MSINYLFAVLLFCAATLLQSNAQESTERLSIIYDPQCPPVQPGQIGTCGFCRRPCPRGTICCPNGCGSSCRPIPVRPTLPPAVCPKDDIVYCFVRPCMFATCRNPSFPRARCYDDYCGGCNAVFKKPNGDVIPSFACKRGSKWPACLALLDCFFNPSGTTCANGCPGVPNAVCSTDCDCSLKFTDPNNGRLLSDRECRRPTTRRCPPLVDPAALVNYSYRCTNRNNIGSVCTISCPYHQTLVGAPSRVTCRRYGRWSHSLEGARCEYDKRCPKPSGGIGICPVCPPRCPRGQICCPTGCGTICISIIPTPTPPYCPGNQIYSTCGTCITSCDDIDKPPRPCPAVCQVGCTCPPNTYLDGDNCLTERQCRNKRRCPVLVYPRILSVTCTNGRKIGSVCRARCFMNQNLVGAPSRVVCLRSARWSGSFGNARCEYDSRCPAYRATGGEGLPAKLSVCPRCPPRCPYRKICCRVGCGSTCIPIPSRNCPPPYDPRAQVSFRLSCSNNYNVGSRCDVRCPVRHTLRGISQIQCLPSRSWNRALGTTQCIPPQTCRPGVRPTFCYIPPCKRARCPGKPEAACIDNYCGGCHARWYLNGRRVALTQCIREVCSLPLSSASSRQPCRITCRNQRCSAHPEAICKVDCFCVPRFYDPITMERVNCS